MKKTAAIFLSLLFIFLCACNSDKNTENDTTEENKANETTEAPIEVEPVTSLEIEELDPAKVYIAYFSHNDPVSAVAEYIYEKNDGELYRIETTKEYPDDEAELIKIAASEVRPELKNPPQNLSNYDIVFLLFPGWNNTMPKALFTYIEDYDMREKAVIPVSYGSEADLQNAMKDIRRLKPEMMIVDGYSFIGDFTEKADEFDTWLNTALYG